MIYIFGDSFSEPFRDINWAWTNIVSNNLQLPVINSSKSACGLEYIFNKFEDCRTKFLSKDVVIIVLTLESRTFFSKDQPENSNITRGNLTDEERTAYEYYLKYLENPISNKINTLNFLHHLKDSTIEKNLHSIVIHGFPNSFNDEINNTERFFNLHISTGNLFEDVNKAECENIKIYNKVMTSNGDLRPNHMTKPNHTIFADKIIKNIQIKNRINLQNEFHQKILNYNMLNNMLTKSYDNW